MATNFIAPITVEDIFTDFSNRRAAIICALTNEADKFHLLCDPENEGLCLYGQSNGKWEVNLPDNEVPTEIPEPVIGINFQRDQMNRREWLSFVAMHSDSWLIAVAFFMGAKLNQKQRDHLHNLINDLPTVLEVVADSSKPANGKQISTSNQYDGETLCVKCGKDDNGDEFWIACDDCDGWFHGECVKITPTQAEYIDKYICPFCKLEREKK